MTVSQAGYPRPFGSYLLLSSFGRGGMGEVFLAKRTAFEGIDRLCVVKTLRGELVNDPEYVRRFLDEARVLVQLHHANISQVFDAGTVGDDYFMAMEYVSGTNIRELATKLTQTGSALDPAVALYVISETLDALAYAHRLVHPMTGEQLSIIHRDVSPHNVMLSFEGETKLIDFGLAESVLKEEQTESAVVLGKVAYMSPEQARGESVDASCDQFAVGVMAYELMAHERFYGAMKTHEIWQIVGHGGFVPRRWANLDPELQAIIARSWDPDPAARYPSCDAMREAIDDYRALRFPRAGKKQARSLMQGLYQERILDERRLLQTFAETSSPGSVAPARSLSGSLSAVAAHSVATGSAANDAPPTPPPVMRPSIGLVEATASSTRQSAEGPSAGGPNAEGPNAEGPNAEGPNADGPSGAGSIGAGPPGAVDGQGAPDKSRSSTLTRQEGAFIADGDPASASDHTLVVQRAEEGTAAAMAAAHPRSRAPLLVVGGAVVVVLLALIAGLWPKDARTGETLNASTNDPVPTGNDPVPTGPVVDPRAGPEPVATGPDAGQGASNRSDDGGKNRPASDPSTKAASADPTADPAPRVEPNKVSNIRSTRRRARRITRPPPPRKPSKPDDDTADVAEATPRVVRRDRAAEPGATAASDPVVKVVKRPEAQPPRNLALGALLDRVKACRTGHKCRAFTLSLPVIKSGELTEAGRPVLERCAFQCDGWRRVQGRWVR